jgi:hypothetical protein
MTFVPQPSAFSLAAARLGDGGTLTGIAVSRAEPAGPHRLWRSLAPISVNSPEILYFSVALIRRRPSGHEASY